LLLAKVVGNMVSTIKPESHHGNKLMIIELFGLDGKPYGRREIVMDVADVGIGDTVLVNVDGGAARMLLDDDDVVADWVICGVIDHYTVDDEVIRTT
jgi:microcompartment protein CcmK/EutM